jgi:phosphopantothenoylcysteine decarboxylase/phosphopantothenate--cysteine ligase
VGESAPGGELQGLEVVLGVSGGIAAYKSVELVRLLTREGARVTPVLTRAALRFVGATTFSALATNPVKVSLFEDEDPSPHTSLARQAELILVAPATARLIGLYANGISGDLLTATLLAARSPVVICPAMHTEMWENPAVQANVALLKERGVRIIGPEAGPLAGGDTGIGRMSEPTAIVAELRSLFSTTAGRPESKLVREAGIGPRGAAGRALAGRHVVVSSGGTREAIDPVRYITNRSSGRQGHAIAREALELGARVTLVSASSLPPPEGVELIEVESAAEMEGAMLTAAKDADVVIMAAAVADFRPKEPSSAKLLRSQAPSELLLEPTPDILAEVVRARRPGQIIVGFAAETGNLLERAREKLLSKGVDMLVANDVTSPGAGFDVDTNHVLILCSDGTEEEVPLAAKEEVARRILAKVGELIVRRTN